MKKLGRRHRPFYRICAVDGRAPRDGRVLEELGTYDPMVSDVDARAVLNDERIDYWLSVGAQPSEKVRVLITKYGSQGTHLGLQRAALDRMAEARRKPEPPMVEPKVETANAEQPPAETLPEETAQAEPSEATDGSASKETEETNEA